MDQLDVLPGTNTSFSITVINTVAPQYIWRRNGRDLTLNHQSQYLGLDTPQLTIVDVSEDDEGTYTVLVRENGQILSDGAQLAVCK